MLMVLVVMSILVGILSLIAQSGLRAFAKVKEETEMVRNVTLALERVRRDLIGSVYLDPATQAALPGVNFVGLDGVDAAGNPDDRLRFFALLSPEGAGKSDLTSINYKRETVGGSNRLSRASRGADSSGLPPLSLDGVENFEPVLFNVTAFDVEYLPTSTGSFQSGYDAQVAGGLPRALRIHLTMKTPQGKEKTFTQTITLGME